MSPSDIFIYCNFTTYFFWGVLLLFPNSALTQKLVHSLVPALVFGPVYTWFILNGGIEGPEGADFSTLEGLMLFFTHPEAVLAGWIHYLVFDLFIGAWEARDAKRHGISRWAVLPCQVLTLLVGPMGLMLYMLLRAVLKRSYTIEEAA